MNFKDFNALYFQILQQIIEIFGFSFNKVYSKTTNKQVNVPMLDSAQPVEHFPIKEVPSIKG